MQRGWPASAKTPAADDLIDADRREIPAPELAAERRGSGGLRRDRHAWLYHFFRPIAKDAASAAPRATPESYGRHRQATRRDARGGADAAGAVLRRSQLLPIARWSGCSRGCGSARAGPSRSSRPAGSSCASCSARPIIITSSPRGSVNAFYNVCRHRGTRLCTEDARHVRRQHPVPVPRLDLRPRRPADRRAAHGRSAALPTRRTIRCTACTPTSGTATSSSISAPDAGAAAASSSAACRRSSAPWRMQDLRLGHRIVYDVKANWKLIIQNYNECLHCPNLHPALNKLSHYLSGENEPLQATYMGGRMDLRPGVDTLSMDGTCPRAILPGLSADDRAARLLLRDLSEHAPQPAPRLHAGAHAVAARARPHDQHLRVALPARRSWRAPGFDPADAVEFWDMTNRQDWHVCELSQAGISSRAYTPGPVFESRGSALRVRSDDRGVARIVRQAIDRVSLPAQLQDWTVGNCSWSLGVDVLRFSAAC